jgi:hypothetical protein
MPFYIDKYAFELLLIYIANLTQIVLIYLSFLKQFVNI